MNKSERLRLARTAIELSLKVRIVGRYGTISPVSIYDICETNSVVVRFNKINMEGMYDRTARPRIHISALRPLGRRAFNCAHEFGHHVLGHGSTIDELKNDDREYGKTPNEFLADVFASFLLMPAMGVRHAFAIREIRPGAASPSEVFGIACNFGVGYTSLVNQLVYGLEMISEEQAHNLRSHTLDKIRRSSGIDDESFWHVDSMWSAPTIDVETKTAVLFPIGTKLEIPGAEMIDEKRSLYRFSRAGVFRVLLPPATPKFLRVSRRDYVGLARYRHLEDEDDDEL